MTSARTWAGHGGRFVVAHCLGNFHCLSRLFSRAGAQLACVCEVGIWKLNFVMQLLEVQQTSQYHRHILIESSNTPNAQTLCFKSARRETNRRSKIFECSLQSLKSKTGFTFLRLMCDRKFVPLCQRCSISGVPIRSELELTEFIRSSLLMPN